MSAIDEMPEDLRWLAATETEWEGTPGFCLIGKDENGVFYATEDCDHAYTKPQWLQARKDLGLEDRQESDEMWSDWIEWNGGECPIPHGVTHQVKHRDGEIVDDDDPDTWEWYHLNMDGDIIAYRYRLDDNTMSPEEEELPAQEWGGRIGGKRTAENFLHEAANLMNERGKQYDQPGGERSMGKAVAALNAITGRGLTEAEGWLLMSLVKRVRQHSGAGYHRDSAEDAVAYAALEAEALESAE